MCEEPGGSLLPSHTHARSHTSILRVQITKKISTHTHPSTTTFFLSAFYFVCFIKLSFLLLSSATSSLFLSLSLGCFFSLISVHMLIHPERNDEWWCASFYLPPPIVPPSSIFPYYSRACPPIVHYDDTFVYTSLTTYVRTQMNACALYAHIAKH